MANYNLTNQPISASFQQLLQKNDSDYLVDGTGSLIQTLKITGSVSSSTYYGDGSNLTGIGGAPIWNDIVGKPAGIVSGSNQVVLTDTQGNLGGNRITGSVSSSSTAVSASYATTASFALNATPTDTGSLLTTASVTNATITFTKGDSSTFDVTVNNVALAIGATNTEVTGKNLEATQIDKGTPVYMTDSGTSGNIVGIYRADASNASRMPAAGIAGEDIAAGAEGAVFLDGYIGGVDTSLFGAGDAIYVADGGGYTNTRPTGSNILVQAIGYVAKSAINGSGVIQGSGRSNDVPNISQGYIWVGNSDGVATPTSTGSFAKTNENNTFTGNQTFNDITVNGTGSFAHINYVTGSATIIGDAFIVLNNDTPTQRYAGIKVADSGSATPVTASFLFDGLTNDWKYQYSSGSDDHDSAIAIFGPEMNDISGAVYPSLNTIQKGGGDHHLYDSNITDDGTSVTITGNLNVNGSFGGSATGSIAFTNKANTFTAGPQEVSGSNGVLHMVHPGSISNNTQLDYITTDTATTEGTNYGLVNYSYQNYPSYGRWYNNSILWEIFDSYGYTYGTETSLNGGGNRTQIFTSGSGTKWGFLAVQDDLISGQQGSTIQAEAQTIKIGTAGGATYRAENGITIGNAAQSPLSLNGNDVSINGGNSISISGNTTFQQSYNTIVSSSLLVNGQSTFDNTIVVSGSVQTEVASQGITSNTASIDFSDTSLFTLNLISGSTTHIDATNVSKGQTVNVLIKQPAGGSGLVSFSSKFLQPTGSQYTPATGSFNQDILTMMTFDNTGTIYVVSSNNFTA